MQALYAKGHLRNRFSKMHSDEKGQITVFLSLMFLVLIGLSLSVVEGVKIYSNSYLAEDAVKGAGENVMANYDKELFKNYHIFFLDPREKNYILSDGKEYINQYFSGNSIFQLSCNSLEVVEEKAVIDENGLYLKHEIREWMKYREEVKIEEKLKSLIRNIVKNNKEKQGCTSAIKEAESAEQSQPANTTRSAGENNPSGDTVQNSLENNPQGDTVQNISGNSPGEDRLQNTLGNSQEEDKSQDTSGNSPAEDSSPNSSGNNEAKEGEIVSPEVAKERATWKEIKETLQLLMKTGVLFYVADHPEKLSKQSISSEGLPSNNKGFSPFEKQTVVDKMSKFSFSDIKEVAALFSEDISVNTKNSLWTKDSYIIPYIEECFSCYGRGNLEQGKDKDIRSNSQKYSNKNVGESKNSNRALFYEMEYLISGKNTDLENLKRVANYILALRFVMNYVFTGKDAKLKAEVDAMAAAITGVMGMPQAVKAVQILIRTALSYGESLLEVHTLLSGGEVPLIKNRGCWNIELKTMVKQLKGKNAVKKGKQNVSYTDFLKMLLLTKGRSDILCYRMMDIMQVNTAYEEPGFLMENCLFSYKWKADLSIGTLQMTFERQNTY